VLVFGSSSSLTPAPYIAAGEELGEYLALNGHACINGGGNTGGMGAVNRGVIKGGGRAVGVIHAKWIGEEDMKGIEMIVTYGEDLTERKNVMFAKSDCIIVLPGGPGTFDEMYEAICAYQLGLGHHPVCLLNVGGFFDSTIAQLDKMFDDGLLRGPWQEIVQVATTPAGAVQCCLDRLQADATSRPRAEKADHPVAAGAAAGAGAGQEAGPAAATGDRFLSGIALGVLVSAAFMTLRGKL
jgi:uncharacterized protein (TIGR00730 family)